MIENDEQLRRTREGINELEAGLAALKRDVLPLNAKQFALMADPVVEYIRDLRKLVEDYVGYTVAVELLHLAEPPSEPWQLPEPAAEERFHVTSVA